MRKEMLMGLMGLVVISCRKEKAVNEVGQLDKSAAVSMTIPRTRTTTGPTRPDRNAYPVNSSRCMNSYQDLVATLGATQVVVRAVILDDGTTITPPAEDLGHMVYKVIEKKAFSSLYYSYLGVQWRADTAAQWEGFTAQVWSLGCLYTVPVGPYTNLLKKDVALLINTSMFWSVGPNAGAHIKYLVID